MTTNTIPARKPFYTRWWFIALAVVLVLGGIGSALGACAMCARRNATVSADRPAARSHSPHA